MSDSLLSLTLSFFQDGMECLANSRNDISFAKTEMEYLIARSRKAIEDYDGGGSGSACGGGRGSAASGSSATTTPLGSPRASFKCVAGLVAWQWHGRHAPKHLKHLLSDVSSDSILRCCDRNVGKSLKGIKT